MVGAALARPGVRSSLGAWCGSVAVALAAWAWVPAAVAAEADAPALRIADDEYVLGTHAVIYRNDHPPHYNDNRYDTTTWPTRHFAQVEAVGPDGTAPADLTFAVEALPDKAAHSYCRRGESTCQDIEIRARADTGLLYVGIDRPYRGGPDPREHAMNDYPAQRMEISAEDADGLKVYRDVLVKPSAKRPDCTDFGADDADRFGCLFLREDLPQETAATTAALRAALPAELVQPAAEYGLIFAEEFDGNADETHSGCHDGLRTLDADVWNHDDDPCAEVDSRGVACGNVENGYYYMGLAKGCRAGINTLGHFAYRYGYLEVKYTVDLSAWSYWYHNTAFVVGSGGSELIHRHDRYGIGVASYGDLLRTVETEVDIFEYVSANRYDIFHQYVNWKPLVVRADMEPRRTIKMYQYCRFDNIKYRGIRFEPSTGCTKQDQVTVTKGVEWTPRGYRTFVKVDGVHEDFMVLPKSHIEVEYRAASTSASGEVTIAAESDVSTYEGTERDRFFEFLDSGDPDSVLEQVGVSHMPLHLGMAAWGAPGNSWIATKMRIQYIRVFQPANLYADMDPVYQ